jgi:hypothetical protein
VTAIPGGPARVAARMARHRLRVRVTTRRGSYFTVNVSRGGICTEQMRVLPVGSRVEGLISFDGRAAFFTGKVMWTLSGDSRLNQLGRMGVRFERIGPELAKGMAERASRAKPIASAA